METPTMHYTNLRLHLLSEVRANKGKDTGVQTISQNAEHFGLKAFIFFQIS